jgi:predicted enzyme related to lactoylglutathione lyase
MTSDPERARTFYGELFGWTVEDPGPDYGGYVNFHKAGAPVAGCMGNDGTMGGPDGWSVYLATDDAKATVAAAEERGSQIIVPAMEVRSLGSMAVFTDAGGAVVGAWQPGEHRAFGLIAEPGAPAWFELHTRDYEATVQFYEEVFGWKTSTMSDTPEFRYTTFGEGEDQHAGIMDASVLPGSTPPSWKVYFAVEDADAAVAEVEQLGGSVVEPPADSPYGRLAEVADPTGARFRVVGG